MVLPSTSQAKHWTKNDSAAASYFHPKLSLRLKRLGQLTQNGIPQFMQQKTERDLSDSL